MYYRKQFFQIFNPHKVSFVFKEIDVFRYLHISHVIFPGGFNEIFELILMKLVVEHFHGRECLATQYTTNICIAYRHRVMKLEMTSSRQLES